MAQKKIKIQFRKMQGTWGLAFTDERRIVLHPDMKQAKLLEIAAHEALHVACPDLAEEAVDRAGKEIACVLKRLGFHLDIEPK